MSIMQECKLFNAPRNKCQNGKHPKGILLVFSVINARETLELGKIKLERLHNVLMMIVRIKILKEYHELFG